MVLFLLLLFLVCCCYSSRAIVTLVYDSSYVDIACLLRFSLTNRTEHLLAMIVPTLDEVSKEVLFDCGWDLYDVPKIAHPSLPFFRREWIYVYSKLNVFGLHRIGFDEVVYLDADTFVLNVEKLGNLWSCPCSVCGAKDVVSGQFNGGVLYVKPSEILFGLVMENYETPKGFFGEQALLSELFYNESCIFGLEYNAQVMMALMLYPFPKESVVLHFNLLPFGKHNSWLMIPASQLHSMVSDSIVREFWSWRYLLIVCPLIFGVLFNVVFLFLRASVFASILVSFCAHLIFIEYAIPWKTPPLIAWTLVSFYLLFWDFGCAIMCSVLFSQNGFLLKFTFKRQVIWDVFLNFLQAFFGIWVLIFILSFNGAEFTGVVFYAARVYFWVFAMCVILFSHLYYLWKLLALEDFVESKFL